MSDFKVFIFGSFTEDETRLFQSQSAQKSPSEKVGSPYDSEKIDLQFGSLDIASLNSVKGFGAESKQTASVGRSKVIQSPNVIAKDPALRDGKSSKSNALQKATKAQANGIPNGCSSTFGISGNGLVDSNLNVAHLCENKPDNVVAPVLNQTLLDRITVVNEDGFEGLNSDNRAIDTSTVVEPAVDAQKKLNEQATPARSLLPRGLINLGNLCFLNATLQALLSCSPFVQLLQDLADRNVPKVGYPTLLAFVEFISDFGISDEPKGKRQEWGVVELGEPFSPVMFDPVLEVFTPDLPSSLSGSCYALCVGPGCNAISHVLDQDARCIGLAVWLTCEPTDREHVFLVDMALEDFMQPFRTITVRFTLRKHDIIQFVTGLVPIYIQEDAQEFLSFVMDRMHNELLKFEGHFSSSNGGSLPLVSSTEDDGWETVGPKNKSAVTRTQSFIPSELSAIFGGQVRSVVKARGIKPSATVQPFLLLHLDILPDGVHTIEDALHLFSAPETLEGYRASAGKAGVVNASKSVKIHTLSKILILHLMRFSYGSRGSTKLHKPVHFPLELVLPRDLLVTPSAVGRKYELVATITHHGQEPSKGHYTADSRHSDGQWLRYDDASVTAVGTNKVLHDQAYVLFYKQL